MSCPRPLVPHCCQGLRRAAEAADVRRVFHRRHILLACHIVLVIYVIFAPIVRAVVRPHAVRGRRVDVPAVVVTRRPNSVGPKLSPWHDGAAARLGEVVRPAVPVCRVVARRVEVVVIFSAAARGMVVHEVAECGRVAHEAQRDDDGLHGVLVPPRALPAQAAEEAARPRFRVPTGPY